MSAEKEDYSLQIKDDDDDEEEVIQKQIEELQKKLHRARNKKKASHVSPSKELVAKNIGDTEKGSHYDDRVLPSDTEETTVPPGPTQSNVTDFKEENKSSDAPVARPTSSEHVETSVLINTSPVDLPQDWKSVAFGSCASDQEWDTRISLLNSMLNERNCPSISFSPAPTNCSKSLKGTEITLKGVLVDRGPDFISKGKHTLVMVPFMSENAPTDISTLSKTKVIIVESGVSKPIFKNLITALKTGCDHEDKRLVIFRGVVQEKKKAFYLCVNNKKCHLALIGINLQYLLVPGMDGAPIDFPMPQTKDNTFRLLGTFRNAWFLPISHAKLTENETEQLRCHISAFRGSKGGVIYLGLKRTRITPQEVTICVSSNHLSLKQLEDLKKQIEEICKSQRPQCLAQEWNHRILPDNINQRLDCCFNSYFDTPGYNRICVVRMIVCPSKHPLHLGSETDIGLRIRHGETSSSYPLSDFITKMSQSTSELKQELKKVCEQQASPTLAKTNMLQPRKGDPLSLWQMLSPEGGDLENKECTRKNPVDFVIEKLEDYCPTWLNDSMGKGGTLRIGVSDMPPLVTGLWVESNATKLLADRLVDRFIGSLEPQNFCFPAAVECITLTKHQVNAAYDALLSKDSKLLVLWLKVPSNENLFDNIRRELYSELNRMFEMPDSSPLALPLNGSLKGLVPPDKHCFPVALSKPHASEIESKLVDELVIKFIPQMKQLVIGYQFVEVSGVDNLLDANYCVLDITVCPQKQNLLYLCKLPKFRKLTTESTDDEHIGGVPKQMTFQEIILQCSDSNLAKVHLTRFFQYNDRPILITDIGSHDAFSIKGLVNLPWMLVVDFQFEKSQQSTLRDYVEDAPHVYKIHDLPFFKDIVVNFDDMLDPSYMYWVKAFGPPNNPIPDLGSWCLHYAPQLSRYIQQACGLLATNVKILVVWSAQQSSCNFGQAVADLCLAAQQAQPALKPEIAVVSLAIVSPFVEKFKESNLPLPPVILSMEVGMLSKVLSQCGPTGDPISARRRSIPKSDSQLPFENVKSMQAGRLDYLYPGIENDLNMLNYDNGLAFFAGAECVRWEDFRAKNVVDRPEAQLLYDEVNKSLLKCNDLMVTTYLHRPGAGGSTIARDVLWRLRTEFCCVVPSQMYADLRKDVKQLINLSDRRAVLVLWDANLCLDFDTLLSTLNGLSVVILCVKRWYEKSTTDHIILEETLSFEMLQQFVMTLQKNVVLYESKDALNLMVQYAKRTKEKVPLFSVMVTALERKFVRLRDYVKERLVNILDEQRSILLQIAFARVYTDQALQVSAVKADDENWESALSSSVLGLIIFSWQQHGRRVRFRHHCIDEVILSEVTGFENSSEQYGLWLSEFVVEFIENLRIVYPNIPESDSSGNNEFERMLRRLFHERAESLQVPNFLSLMSQLAGKRAVVACMKNVEEKLPDITRIRAHFLGDLARVHLHIADMDLTAASCAMEDAHKIFPHNRTLHHQEGQLYYDAMKLIQTTSTLLDTKTPTEMAEEIIDLAQKASECFEMSRNCKMQGRASELYPWVTDAICNFECITDICTLMNCSFKLLPQQLASHSYLLHSHENIMYLLEMLSTEDPNFYSNHRRKVLELVGTSSDVREEIKKLFDEIDHLSHTDEKNDTLHTLSTLAHSLQKASYLLRLKYGSARDVPPSYSHSLTYAVAKVIEKPRVIKAMTAHKGNENRFFELELLWEWSRYSDVQISHKGMLSIIDAYLDNMPQPSLPKAKGLLFKSVTQFLMLCEEENGVNPVDVGAPISQCQEILQKENRRWDYSEFLTEGYGKGLLSSKDWFKNGPLHREINNSKSLNSNRDPSQHTTFREFSGTVLRNDHHGAVAYKGLQLMFAKHNAPNDWRVNSTEVKFYIAITSKQGLRAFPVCTFDASDRSREQIHRWIPRQLQKGVIEEINYKDGIVYFVPEGNKAFRAKAHCRFEDIPLPPKKGDIYEFKIEKVKSNVGSISYEAYKLKFISSPTI